MKRRTLLVKNIELAWRGCLESDYPRGLINGERALQACLYHRLMDAFKNQSTRRIFIEPSIEIETMPRRHPDMVICDRDKIIAIIELKFHPKTMLSGKDGDNVRLGTRKDIESLRSIATSLQAEKLEGSAALQVNIDRYLGTEAKFKQRFNLAPNVLLVWAGMYKRSTGAKAPQHERLVDMFDAEHPGGLLELHARAEKGEVLKYLPGSFGGW